MKRWKAGNRITRQIYLDDGTWQIKGDSCLSQSPLRHGEVLYVEGREVIVRFDDGAIRKYLSHGIEEETGVNSRLSNISIGQPVP